MMRHFSGCSTTELHPQSVEVEGYDLLPDEVLVDSTDKEGYAVSSDAGYVVAVTTEVSKELAMEGTARELVHRIQNMRRSISKQSCALKTRQDCLLMSRRRSRRS